MYKIRIIIFIIQIIRKVFLRKNSYQYYNQANKITIQTARPNKNDTTFCSEDGSENTKSSAHANPATVPPPLPVRLTF